ncbi:MAG: NAD-dependent epimerase/dehydratase family protein [Actinobacteria bacterium]|nr:NAD-dependent epimerase/dehydratase family protein [Actinomycetota bacterium]
MRDEPDGAREDSGDVEPRRRGTATCLVTGAAGFIGYHLTRRLLADGHHVVALDNLDDYYDPALKRARLSQLDGDADLLFREADVCDRDLVTDLVRRHRPEVVFHLAAQVGVRDSLPNPHAYARTNLVGFVNVAEACRRGDVGHLVYASSSSVHGANAKTPFSVHEEASHPTSLYGATKRANELMAHAYSHLHTLPTTGLRFFTVYGPWGRPDMAYFSFAEAIATGRPVRVFGDGRARRDFTYVDDVVEAVVRVGARPAAVDPQWTARAPDPATSDAPYRVHNVGRGRTVSVRELIATLERLLGRDARVRWEGPQPGDVPATQAEVADLHDHTGLTPAVGFAEGMRRFVRWFVAYRGLG